MYPYLYTYLLRMIPIFNIDIPYKTTPIETFSLLKQMNLRLQFQWRLKVPSQEKKTFKKINVS